MKARIKSISPWAWVLTLYFAEGLPYVAAMILSLVMYKRMGISNTDIALYTSWLNLPWVIKPLWRPVRRFAQNQTLVDCQHAAIARAGLAGIAFTIPTDRFFQLTLAVFWLIAFSSATHDIAADGFYMLGLTSHQQALFVGIRSTFYRFATIAGQGLLIMLAGFLEKTSGRIDYAWSITFFILSGMILALWLYHSFLLPRPADDCPAQAGIRARNILYGFGETIASFFRKKQALAAILFMLLYRLPEAQLAKMGIPFLLDPPEKGGLGMTTAQIGFSQGTLGGHRTDFRRDTWRNSRVPTRTETLAMADGMGHFPPRHRLCIHELCPSFQPVDHQQLHIHRTVRLRIRIHRLHALFDLFFKRRESQDFPLCHLHGFHGTGHDASGHDCRMDARNFRIPAFLCLDYGLHARHFRCNRLAED